MEQASNANKKLRDMFEQGKPGFEVLFKSENELEELFETYKAKKHTEEDLKN